MKDVISVGTTGGDTIESQLKQLLSNSITVYGAGTDPKAIVSGATDYLVSELLQLFHSLLISKLPEKRGDTPHHMSIFNEGYTQAVQDMRKSIDELFRSGDE